MHEKGLWLGRLGSWTLPAPIAVTGSLGYPNSPSWHSLSNSPWVGKCRFASLSRNLSLEWNRCFPKEEGYCYRYPNGEMNSGKKKILADVHLKLVSFYFSQHPVVSDSTHKSLWFYIYFRVCLIRELHVQLWEDRNYIFFVLICVSRAWQSHQRTVGP